MSLKQQIRNQHLLWRAGFGVPAEQILALQKINEGDLYNTLEKNSAETSLQLILMNDESTKKIMAPNYGNNATTMQQQSPDDKRKLLRIKSVKGLKELNVKWMKEMANSPAQLREKLSLFWHGHFACRVINIYYQQVLLHAIRSNALEILVIY